MKKKITVIISLFLLNILTGCGQKGALYLPNDGQTINSSNSQYKDNFLISQKSREEINQKSENRQ